MKICFILENFYPKTGGGEILFYNLAKRLVQEGHSVRVVTSHFDKTKKEELLDGIKIYRYKWPSFLNHAIAKKSDLEPHVRWADIVHTSTYTAAIPALRVSNKYGKHCIITVHEVLGRKWYWVENPIIATLLFIFEEYVVRQNFDAYHCVSKATAGDLENAGVDRERIFTIYPGVDIAKSKESPTIYKLFSINKTKKIFLYYGRYGKTKGINILLKAIALVQTQIPKEFMFGFVTDNPEKIADDIKKYGINPEIILNHLGVPHDKISGIIKSAYCVIVPSITEGFGFTTAETCQLSTPVICSDAGSLLEVVSGKCSVFENRNHFDLVQKIKLAVKIQFGFIIPRHFLWVKTDRAIEELYQKLLKDNTDEN